MLLLHLVFPPLGLANWTTTKHVTRPAPSIKKMRSMIGWSTEHVSAQGREMTVSCAQRPIRLAQRNLWGGKWQRGSRHGSNLAAPINPCGRVYRFLHRLDVSLLEEYNFLNDPCLPHLFAFIASSSSSSCPVKTISDLLVVCLTNRWIGLMIPGAGMVGYPPHPVLRLAD